MKFTVRTKHALNVSSRLALSLCALALCTQAIPASSQQSTALTVSSDAAIQYSTSADGEALPDAQGSKPASSIGQLKSTAHASGSFPTASQRRKQYLYELLGPGAVVSTLVQTTVDETHPLKVAYPSDGYPGPLSWSPLDLLD